VDLKAELIAKAKSFIGTTEQGGDNKGPVVEMFQKAYDGRAAGEAWCAAFVVYCIKDVEATHGVRCGLNLSEHCMTLWNTNSAARRTEPKPGYIVIWKKNGTDLGHAGLVTALSQDEPVKFHTVEGNTGPGAGVERNGDGVYPKYRSMAPMGEMICMGFLEPFV
jgi:hypothetical protein